MEDDDLKKSSSLPPNYVSLVQLQERWLQEKQRNQREKEEEEEHRKRREKEHEDRENQEKLQNKNGDTSKQTNKSFRRRSFNNNRPKKSSEKSEESQVVMIVEPKKIDDFKKKKMKKKEKPSAEERLIGGSERLLLENEPAAVEEKDKKSVVVSSDVQRTGKNLVVHGGRVWEKKVRVDGSEEIGGKLKEISVSGERYGRNIDGSLRNYNRDPTRFNDRRRVTNKVWVKKGESSDVDFAGGRSSGVAAKDGEGQRKPVQMRRRIPVRESYRKHID